MTLYSGRDTIRRCKDPSLGPTYWLNLLLNSITNIKYPSKKNDNFNFRHSSIRNVSFLNWNKMVQLNIYHFPHKNVYIHVYDIYIKYIKDF